MAKASAETRTGRRAGTHDNRAAILTAARQEFATKGFQGATLRSIAAVAGVDVALLSHYFGNKDGLFAATLELPPGMSRAFAAVLTGPPEGLGERVTRWYLGLWEEPATGEQMRILARAGLSSEAASTRIRALLSGATTGREVRTVATEYRAGLSLAMPELLGIAIVRHLSPAPPLAELDFETLVARLSPGIQLHFQAALS
jgi:AcrR family transcriptional regulator